MNAAETFSCQGCDYSGDRDGAIEHCDRTGHTLTNDDKRH